MTLTLRGSVSEVIAAMRGVAVFPGVGELPDPPPAGAVVGDLWLNLTTDEFTLIVEPPRTGDWLLTGGGALVVAGFNPDRTGGDWTLTGGGALVAVGPPPADVIVGSVLSDVPLVVGGGAAGFLGQGFTPASDVDITGISIRMFSATAVTVQLASDYAVPTVLGETTLNTTVTADGDYLATFTSPVHLNAGVMVWLLLNGQVNLCQVGTPWTETSVSLEAGFRFGSGYSSVGPDHRLLLRLHGSVAAPAHSGTWTLSGGGALAAVGASDAPGDTIAGSVTTGAPVEAGAGAAEYLGQGFTPATDMDVTAVSIGVTATYTSGITVRLASSYTPPPPTELGSAVADLTNTTADGDHLATFAEPVHLDAGVPVWLLLNGMCSPVQVAFDWTETGLTTAAGVIYGAEYATSTGAIRVLFRLHGSVSVPAHSGSWTLTGGGALAATGGVPVVPPVLASGHSETGSLSIDAADGDYLFAAVMQYQSSPSIAEPATATLDTVALTEIGFSTSGQSGSFRIAAFSGPVIGGAPALAGGNGTDTTGVWGVPVAQRFTVNAPVTVTQIRWSAWTATVADALAGIASEFSGTSTVPWLGKGTTAAGQTGLVTVPLDVPVDLVPGTDYRLVVPPATGYLRALDLSGVVGTVTLMHHGATYDTERLEDYWVPFELYTAPSPVHDVAWAGTNEYGLRHGFGLVLPAVPSDVDYYVANTNSAAQMLTATVAPGDLLIACTTVYNAVGSAVITADGGAVFTIEQDAVGYAGGQASSQISWHQAVITGDIEVTSTRPEGDLRHAFLLAVLHA